MLLQLLFAAFVVSIVASAACGLRHRQAPVSAARDVAPSSSTRDASVLEDSTASRSADLAADLTFYGGSGGSGVDAIALSVVTSHLVLPAHDGTPGVTIEPKFECFVGEVIWNSRDRSVMACVRAPHEWTRLLYSPLPSCHDNLCGGEFGESYCSCHGTGAAARCWSTSADCEVDAKCCDGRPDYCNGLRLDDCADATSKARKARDAKAVTP